MYYAIFQMLRPSQWIKNLFVFAPLLFALRFNNQESWLLSFVACAAFICASSIIYIINDIRDRDHDRHHPEKRFRPIAAGTVPIRVAFFTLAFLLGILVGLVLALPKASWLVLAIYVFQNILYTFWLKKIAIIDVLLMAVGNVLRVLCGGLAIGAGVSPWLLICTLMLSLFMGFCKRYYEIRRLNQPDSATLGAYNLPMLDRMISVSCGASLVTYAMATVEMASLFKNSAIVYTVVFVVFGLFRYLQYVYYSKKGGEPERILFNDPLFIGNFVLWLITTIWILSSLSSAVLPQAIAQPG